MSLYSSYNYSSSPKTSSYQRSYAGAFNSPKNELQKPFSYTTRLKNDNSRYLPKSEKMYESSLERRTPTNRPPSASRTQGFSSTYSGSGGFYDAGRDYDDKKSSVDSYKPSQNYGQSSYRNQSSTPLSKSVYLRDTTTEEPILTRKKYDIDTNLTNSAMRVPTDSRPHSTKNSEARDSYEENPKKGSVTYYPLEEFISKYSLNKTSTGTQNSKYSVDKNDYSTRSFGLNRGVGSTATKAPATPLRSSHYLDSNNTPSNSTSSKVNNFFDRQDNNETPYRSSSSSKVSVSPTHFEYKKTEYKPSYGTSSGLDRSLLTRSEHNLRKTFGKTDIEYENRTPVSGTTSNYRGFSENRTKENSYLGQTTQNEDKPSLSSFITKVERGGPVQAFNRSDSRTPDGKSGNLRNSYLTESSSKTSVASKESPFKASQGNSKFSKTAEKFGQDYESPYSTDVARWTGKSTRPSTARHDESTDSSDEDQRKNTFTYYMTHLEKHLRNYDERDYFSQIYREHFQQSFQALKLCKYMKVPDARVLAKKKVYLPKSDAYRNKKTLVLDLDETLIHCNDSPMKRSDVKLPIRFPQGDIIEAGINVRPYALEFLKEMNQHFEVIVFTASHKCYANVVLDYLDPYKQYIQHRLYRDSCVYTDEGVYVKDLRVIANRNLQDLILVDNAAYSFGFQIENGVPIIPFYENKTDQELRHLIPFLKRLSTMKDPREIIKKTFKFKSYSLYNSQDEVMNNIIF